LKKISKIDFFENVKNGFGEPQSVSASVVEAALLNPVLIHTHAHPHKNTPEMLFLNSYFQENRYFWVCGLEYAISSNWAGK